MGEHVPIDYGGVCGDFVNLKMMCRLNFLEVLTWVGMRVCIQRSECKFVCMSVYVCTVLKNVENWYGSSWYALLLMKLSKLV